MSTASTLSPTRIELVDQLAHRLVDAGRVVPGLVVDDGGRGRAQWWPLPIASDRAALAALLDGDGPEAHRRLADELTASVDAEVRARLTRRSDGVPVLPPKRGRKPPAEAWLAALVGDDPLLPASIAGDKLDALESAVAGWVRSGVPATGSVRLCVRVAAPDPTRDTTAELDLGDDDVWWVELLVQDVDEPSLIVSIAQLWSGEVSLGPTALTDVLAALGHLDRLAPELSSLLDQPEPTALPVDPADAVRLLVDRAGPLADAGIAVLLPSWWTKRRRLGVRMRASSRAKGPTAVKGGGLGVDQLVSFQWEAALGDDALTEEELLELARAAEAKRTVVRFRGEWVEVSAEGLAAIVELTRTKGRTSVGEVLRTSLGLSDLELPDDVELDEVVADGWLGELLDDAVHARVQAVPTPADFGGELRPYQELGVGWLAFLGRLGLGACLADDMGLGKTAQVIAAVLADPVDGPTLVVCPVSVLGNWQAELARFAPQLDVLVHHGAGRHRDHDESFAERAVAHDVVLTTYSLLARDVEELATVDWGRFVLDEAQQVKNPGTQATRAVQRLHADRRVALTGTPVENRLSELWSIMHLLNPGLLGTASAFRTRFAIPIERDGEDEPAETLRRLTGPFLLRRLKTDRSIIADLPDKIEMVDHCPLTREQASLYQAVVDDLLDASSSTDGMERRGLVLAGLLRLKQVCNHPAHYLRDGSALAGRSGKLERVEELLDELLEAGDKALCFTQFREWGDLLTPYLAQRFGTEVLWLHGGVRRPRRDEMVERFADPEGPRLFLISLKAGGTGLNLTAASHVVHLDRWWNPAVEDQATDRAYRIGQHRNVLVHKLVSQGTVEERIDAMITEKRALAERVVGTGETWITELSTDELADLVRLR